MNLIQRTIEAQRTKKAQSTPPTAVENENPAAAELPDKPPQKLPSQAHYNHWTEGVPESMRGLAISVADAVWALETQRTIRIGDMVVDHSTNEEDIARVMAILASAGNAGETSVRATLESTPVGAAIERLLTSVLYLLSVVSMARTYINNSTLISSRIEPDEALLVENAVGMLDLDALYVRLSETLEYTKFR